MIGNNIYLCCTQYIALYCTASCSDGSILFLKLLRTRALIEIGCHVAWYMVKLFKLYKLDELQLVVHIAQNCTKLYEIAQTILFNCTKLYNICLYCSTYDNVVQSCLRAMQAAAASMLAAALMLPVPLTVLLRYEFVTNMHLLSTTAPSNPSRGISNVSTGRYTSRSIWACSSASGSSSCTPPAESRLCFTSRLLPRFLPGSGSL